MKKGALIVLVCILVLTLFIGGCIKKGHTITIGPTDLDPDATAPTILSGEGKTPTKTTRTSPKLSEDPDEIMARISSSEPGEFDCDAEVEKLEAILIEAREINIQIEEEFFDVLRELESTQKAIERNNNSGTQAPYARAQADYEETNARAKKSRENIKILKVAINFARDRCENPIRDVVTPEEAAPAPPVVEDVCRYIDNIAENLKDELQDLFDKEQDRLDELFERYDLEDDLDEADANGDDMDGIVSDIDEKNGDIDELKDEIDEHRDEVEDLRRALNQKKDECILPHVVTRICTLDRKDIEETIGDLGDDIRELENEIDDARAERRTAIEDDETGDRDDAEGALSSKRSTLREKMEELSEEKDNLFAYRMMC